MTILVAIPVFRIGCRVAIDKGRGWSVIEETVLWSLTRRTFTIAELMQHTRLDRQIIVAAIARLMQFRLIEAQRQRGAAFRASTYGTNAVTTGHPLPVFPKRFPKSVSFVIERVCGEFYHWRDVNLMSPPRLDEETAAGADVRIVAVDGGGPSMSNDANLVRLSQLAAGGWNEEIATIDSRTAELRGDEFMIVRVTDGVPRGLPERAGATLRKIVAKAAAAASTARVRVAYAGPPPETEEPTLRPCHLEPGDLVIGGPGQKTLFVDLLEKAHRRCIIHSTFLSAERFRALIEPIRAACQAGVTFDLLWGTERDEDSQNRTAAAASQISRDVQADPVLRGRFRVHMGTTGSHAKFLFIDTKDGWLGAVGSCNWIWSPFKSVELSVRIRDNALLADLATAIQRMTCRRGLADGIANEMALTARDLRRMPSSGGSARMAIIVGEAHDQMIRVASGTATKRFFIGCHRLGSTARPGALLQGQTAAERPGVRATILYNQPSGPLKNRHTQPLREEAAHNNVDLIRAKSTVLHGKIVAWDNNDIVVTSLNWASAAADPDFPWGDIGVHIEAPGIADAAMTQLARLFPEIDQNKDQAQQI
jgi:phosphatidylserine/phosphatidylglycerophosphate/cardiolipin synthase-like enzyme